MEADNPLEVEAGNLLGVHDGSNHRNLGDRGILLDFLMVVGRAFRAVAVDRRDRVVEGGSHSRVLEGGNHEGMEHVGEVMSDTLATDFVDGEANGLERDTHHSTPAADTHDSTDHQTPDAAVEADIVEVNLGDAGVEGEGVKSTAFLRGRGDDHEVVQNRRVCTLRVRGPSHLSGSLLRGFAGVVDRIRRTDDGRVMSGVVNESGPGRRCEMVDLLLLLPLLTLVAAALESERLLEEVLCSAAVEGVDLFVGKVVCLFGEDHHGPFFLSYYSDDVPLVLAVMRGSGADALCVERRSPTLLS